MLCIAVFLLLVAWAETFYNGNLNYNSPSRRHDSLGISLPKVQKRLVNDFKFVARDVRMSLNFTHGVASGDPLHDRVILWTRLAPTSDTEVNSPICLAYQVAPSRSFTEVLNQGKAYTSSDIDYTVKVDATGLQPFTWYYYRFQSCDGSITSPIGRTKTAPHPGDNMQTVIRFAVYSCANYRTIPPFWLMLQPKGSLMPMVVPYGAIQLIMFCI